MDTFNESLLPSGISNMIKKLVKNPVKSGIAMFLIWQILKPYMNKKKKESSYITTLKELQTKLVYPDWKDDSKNNNNLPKQISKDKIVRIGAEPIKDKKTGKVSHIYTVYVNNKAKTRDLKLKDAKINMKKHMGVQ